MRIGIGELFQETCVFSPLTTTREQFDVAVEEDIIDEYEDTGSELGGFIDVFRQTEREAELYPVRASRMASLCGGPVADEFFREFVDRFISEIEEEPLDAVLLALHGSMLTDNSDDPEGEFLQAVRETIGDTPIIASLDHHANVTRQMVEAADALVAYLTYPHIDVRETGERAAQLTIEIVKDQVQPVMSMVKTPIVMSHGHQTTQEPLKTVFNHREQFADKENVLGAFYFPCHAWLDVPDMGSTALVVTDNVPNTGGEIATQLAKEAWTRREKFHSEFPDATEVIDRCLSEESGPIVLSDRGDITLAGAPGDSPIIVRELFERANTDELSAVVPIVDPEITRTLAECPAVRAPVEIGGKLTPEFSPISLTGDVIDVFEGAFELEGSYYSGKTFDLGKRVVFQPEESETRLLLSEQAGTTTDPSFYTAHGLDPESFDVVVVKSANHFRPNFEPIASRIIPVDTPGSTSINLSRFEYDYGRPFYPRDDPEPEFAVFQS